ncbi:MAG: hypothetical protein JWP19_1926 [Rhodoglobus sp.]|nr:hypothetical protein [Rhodoglobus sp.]
MSDVVIAQSHAPARGLAARLFGLSPLMPQSRVSYHGALGELLVGDVLENLGTNWDVLHDLPLGHSAHHGGVLDHLVIGPAGVYAVHVANYTDRDVIVAGDHLLLGGEPHDDIVAAQREAEAAAMLLSAVSGSAVQVRPLLVVVNPRRLSVRVAASGVRVIPSYQLERFLSRAPRTLTGDEVASISDIADLASTWPDAAPARLDVRLLHRQFAVVRDEVRGAVVHRVLWTAFGIGVLYAGVWALVASFVSVLISR